MARSVRFAPVGREHRLQVGAGGVEAALADEGNREEMAQHRVVGVVREPLLGEADGRRQVSPLQRRRGLRRVPQRVHLA